MKKAIGLAAMLAATICFSARASVQEGPYYNSGPIPNNGTTFSAEQTVSGVADLITSVQLTLTFNSSYDLNGNITGTLILNPAAGGNTYVTFTPSVNGALSAGTDGQEIYTVTFTGPTSSLDLQNPNNIWALDLWDTGSGGIENGLVSWQLNLAGTSPVPEPITYALALFGLVFVGGGVGRHYLRRQKLGDGR